MADSSHHLDHNPQSAVCDILGHRVACRYDSTRIHRPKFISGHPSRLNLCPCVSFVLCAVHQRHTTYDTKALALSDRIRRVCHHDMYDVDHNPKHLCLSITVHLCCLWRCRNSGYLGYLRRTRAQQF